MSEQINAALNKVIADIRQLGPDAFRAQIETHQSGDIALSLGEIRRFGDHVNELGITRLNAFPGSDAASALQVLGEVNNALGQLAAGEFEVIDLD